MRIVLEGGGCRSAYTSGILEVLAKNGLRVDSIVGSSSGAMNAAFFAAEQTERLSELWANERVVKRMVSIPRFLNPFSGPALDIDFLVDEQLRGLKNLDPVKATTGKTRFYTIATEVGQMVPEVHIPTAETIWPWLKASMAMPVAYNRLVDIGKKKYVDTGVLSPVPYEVPGLPPDEDITVVIVTRLLGVLKAEPAVWQKWLLRRITHPSVADATLTQHDTYNQMIADLVKRDQEGRIILVGPPAEQPVSRLTTNGEKLRAGQQVGRKVGETLLRRLEGLV